MAVSSLTTTFDAALGLATGVGDTSLPSASLQFEATYSALDTLDSIIIASPDEDTSSLLTAMRDVAAKIDLIPDVFSEVRKDFQLEPLLASRCVLH